MKPFESGSRKAATVAPAPVCIRPATEADRGAIERLARRATDGLLGPVLSAEQAAATSAFTPLDPWLIEDGTYFVLEIDSAIRASGGWSRRSPLIHDPQAQSSHTPCEETRSARIRAMYTDPSHARMGLARSILSVCEASARLAGMIRLDLIATPVGEFLYSACGYEVVERIDMNAPGGAVIPVARMQKHTGTKVVAVHPSSPSR